MRNITKRDDIKLVTNRESFLMNVMKPNFKFKFKLKPNFKFASVRTLWVVKWERLKLL